MALGDLFAPAYIPGDAASEKAVSDWMAKNYGLTSADVEATRMPNPYQPPSSGINAFSPLRGMMGGGGNTDFGDPRGTVDPEALKVLAQGGHYDMDARRNAIAQQVASNNAAQTAHANPAAAVGGGMGVLPRSDYNPYLVDPRFTTGTS